MNFRDVINIAQNGCIHEFHIGDLMNFDRSVVVACKKCPTQATLGEIAWMLTGAKIVMDENNAIVRANEQAIEQLNRLAAMPCHGSVN